MNLRDYFALEAMSSILRVRAYKDVKAFAEKAYELADAMLEERNKYV